MRKGFLIYEKMRKYFPYMRRPLVIYGFATCMLYSNFHIYEDNFLFFFISVHSRPANFHSTRLKMLMTNPSHQLGILWSQWKIRQIKSNAKWHYLKKLTCKMDFAAGVLSVWGPLSSYDPHTPLLEKVRGAIGHKAGRKYQHDWLYLQFINYTIHQ